MSANKNTTSLKATEDQEDGEHSSLLSYLKLIPLEILAQVLPYYCTCAHHRPIPSCTVWNLYGFPICIPVIDASISLNLIGPWSSASRSTTPSSTATHRASAQFQDLSAHPHPSATILTPQAPCSPASLVNCAFEWARISDHIQDSVRQPGRPGPQPLASCGPPRCTGRRLRYTRRLC